jgi:histone-lysine N-methyltransferase SETD3
MDAWLNKSGAVGLGDLDLADFPETGRGVKAQRPFKEGERILTVPANCLWTVKGAYADPLFGPVLQSVQPPLSVEDTLALYILFVRSRVGDPAYAERQSHVTVLPSEYTLSMFFTEEELRVCAGSSLYTLTTHLRGRVGDDYKKLLTSVFMRHRDLFPLDKFSFQDVSSWHALYHHELTRSPISTNGHSARYGVVVWTLPYLRATLFAW